MRAVFVHLAFPEWSMTCRACREFRHDERGQIRLTQSQQPVQQRRIPGESPPCFKGCRKIDSSLPRDTKRPWEHAADITEEVEAVWRYYRLCQTINRFPVDEIVEECAIQIADAERMAKERDRDFEAIRTDFIIQSLALKVT